MSESSKNDSFINDEDEESHVSEEESHVSISSTELDITLDTVDMLSVFKPKISKVK